MDKVLAFDIWGDYGHFRKYYTTSSPLTFSIPPRTSICGLIGAILGLRKSEYLNYFYKKDASIGIRLLSPIKKARIGINLINTKDNYWIPVKKGGHEPRTQIRTEFIKDARFRIFFSHTDQNIYRNLKENLKKHKTVYTLSLGLSELLCNFSFTGEYTLQEKNKQETDIHSVVPTSQLAKRKESIIIEDGKKYFKEKLPTEMTPDRIVTEYGEVIYEAEGKTIKIFPKKYWELENGETILFL